MSTFTLTDDHRQRMADGRQASATVRKYLESLRQDRVTDVSSIEAAIGKIDAVYPIGDATLDRALVQRRAALLDEKDAASALEIDELQAAFVKVAAEYGERKHITYASWRSMGVEPHVLAAAGIKMRR